MISTTGEKTAPRSWIIKLLVPHAVRDKRPMRFSAQCLKNQLLHKTPRKVEKKYCSIDFETYSVAKMASPRTIQCPNANLLWRIDFQRGIEWDRMGSASAPVLVSFRYVKSPRNEPWIEPLHPCHLKPHVLMYLPNPKLFSRTWTEGAKSTATPSSQSAMSPLVNEATKKLQTATASHYHSLRAIESLTLFLCGFVTSQLHPVFTSIMGQSRRPRASSCGCPQWLRNQHEHGSAIIISCHEQSYSSASRWNLA